MLNERTGSKGHVLHDSIYGVLLKRENFIDEDISVCQALELETMCPLENGTLTAGFPLGVSNHFTGKAARVSVEKGSLLVLWDKKNGFPKR